MNIDQVVAIAQRVHDAERFNLGSSSTRDSRNLFWSRVIGIVHWGHSQYNPTPDPQWHLKNAGGGRAQSDDVAVSLPSRQFWDCIPSSGADGYRFQASGGEVLPPEQEVYAPPRPSDTGVVTPPPSLSQYWTDQHKAVLQQLNGPTTLKAAQQLAFSFPAEGWGQKRTQSGPPSPDVIGRQVDGTLIGVRIATNEVLELPNQVFVAVTPTNYLATPTPVPIPTPTVEPTPEVLSAIARLTAQIEQLVSVIHALPTVSCQFQPSAPIPETEPGLKASIDSLNDKLDKGFVLEAKAGWPVGNIKGSAQLRP